MLQVTNNTPFSAGLDVLPDVRGVDTVYVAVKASFELGSPLRVAEEQVPLHASDVYWGEPGQSSIRYPADRHPTKPSTDVLLVGQAHAPRGEAVSELMVEFAVADVRRAVRVVGDRFWTGAASLSRATTPVPFVAMPLVYERAFGGCYVPEQGPPRDEPRNPVGRGFRGARGRAMKGLLLPNLEDPRSPVLGAGDAAIPACFAPVAPAWSPRRECAGTYDEAWHRHRAPYLPHDFDPRFFNVAPEVLRAPGYLRGGEAVRLENAAVEGPLRCLLPICRFFIEVRIAGDRRTLRPELETVLIEPDARRLCMVWRAATSCDKRVLQIERATLWLEELRLA
ncbi:DUF2169 family type VI secretion system accessory protein [Nannocystis bainbridge]|uniref:DUF2169 domain-containing protein n=1 Tax=Nannocystis bainbridge TaxID=2995303 RepID=A0ABT5DW61_9BACT|nr:DUF2169 domain-containing protein [Nannocystis bainbridge]MDC0717877.1 DUF2169 domain-containing protein [Nannocystis bainbridge]